MWADPRPRPSETKDFVPSRKRGARREASEAEGRCRRLEMTSARIESRLFFQLYLYHYSFSSLSVHEAENCRNLFFQEIMFFKSVFCRVVSGSLSTLLCSVT